MEIKISKPNDNETLKIKEFVSKNLQKIFNAPAQGIEDLDNISDNFEKFFIAKQDGKLIGTIGLKKEGERYRIAKMYVDKSQRGKGIGMQLMDKLLEYCKNNDIKDLFLTTYKQMNSVGFYKKMGFEIIKTKNDEVFMRKKQG